MADIISFPSGRLNAASGTNPIGNTLPPPAPPSAMPETGLVKVSNDVPARIGATRWVALAKEIRPSMTGLAHRALLWAHQSEVLPARWQTQHIRALTSKILFDANTNNLSRNLAVLEGYGEKALPPLANLHAHCAAADAYDFISKTKARLIAEALIRLLAKTRSFKNADKASGHFGDILLHEKDPAMFNHLIAALANDTSVGQEALARFLRAKQTVYVNGKATPSPNWNVAVRAFIDCLEAHLYEGKFTFSPNRVSPEATAAMATIHFILLNLQNEELVSPVFRMLFILTRRAKAYTSGFETIDKLENDVRQSEREFGPLFKERLIQMRWLYMHAVAQERGDFPARDRIRNRCLDRLETDVLQLRDEALQRRHLDLIADFGTDGRAVLKNLLHLTERHENVFTLGGQAANSRNLAPLIREILQKPME